MSSHRDVDHWDERYRSVESVWSDEPNATMVEFCEGLESGKMLDLGGGEGRNALWFARRGWSVENSDFSSVAIEKFRERANHEVLSGRCVGTVASATTLDSCTTSPVDLVVVCFLHLTTNDLGIALNLAAGALREGGLLFGIWHDRSNIGRGLGGPQSAEFTPTVQELRQHAARAGLVVRVCETRERVAERDGMCGTAVDVVLFASR